jgi:hypothetical protein
MNNFTSIFHQIFILFIIAILTSCGGGDSSTPAPTPGTLQLSAASYSGTEGIDAVVKVSVTRTGGDDGDASVDYAVADSSADSGDYSVNNIGRTLRWADGDATSREINIGLINDTSVELTEALTVTLNNASTATLGSNSSATVSINDDDSIVITGVVSAPNGSVSFNGPTYMEHMLASLFGKSVHATISDLVSPVPSVKVSVYEVDADGNLVNSAPITTMTTDGHGAYTLAAPLDAPASKYIVRAESTDGDLDSHIIATNINVDPVTDATSSLVAYAATDLATMSVDEIAVIQQEVGDLVVDIDASSLTATQLSAELNTEALNNEEIANVVTSSAAAGAVCGTVTNSSNDPLGDINIVVRDFGNWVTRAKTKTADDGRYCVNLPVAGEYILGAMNRTGDSIDSGLHASEWWSMRGIAYNQYDAEKIAVPDETVVSDKNFMLEHGSRIRGTVTASNTGTGLEGVKVVVRDFDNRTPLASARSKADGSYRVNVIPGKYLLVARNKTIQPYASEVYDGSTGSNDRNEGIPVTVSQGTSTPRSFALEAGHQLGGTITDNSNPVSGMRVMIDNFEGGSADRLRTNTLGEYRIWLKPDSYQVYAYGQRNLAVDLTSTNQIIDFSGTVNAVSAILKDGAGNPLSQVKLRLYDLDPVRTYLGLEISNSDGTVTMHTDQTYNHVAEFKIDRVSAIAGNIYDSKTQLDLGDVIPITNVDVDLGTVNLPEGGVLTGHVYAGNFGDTTTPPDTTTPIANFSVEVRDGGTDPINRFTRIRTRGDGSYVLTIPPGTYERVKLRDATVGGNCDDIIINQSATTTVNYYDGDDTCELIP